MPKTEIKILCRSHKMSGLAAPDILHKLSSNQLECPLIVRRIVEMKEPERGNNVSCQELVAMFPEACAVCKLKPEWTDFRIIKIL
jgi:hypothetical protein